jgi:hypothetical protein
MVNQSLVMFIQNSLNHGMDINLIRNELLQQGHNPMEIDEAINFVFAKPQHVHHTIAFSKSTIIAMVAGVFGIALTVYLVVMLLNPATPSKLLDFETNPVDKAVKAGEELSFDIRIINMGPSGRVDVEVSSMAMDESGTIVGSKTDTFAVDTRLAERMSINIASDAAPGRYTIKSTASYTGGSAKSDFQFSVYEDSGQPSCYDNEQNQGEEGVDCGGPCSPCATCSDGIRNQGESGVDCGEPCEADCCSNGYQDAGEDGVDCGGDCEPCETGCGDCDDGNPCTTDRCIDEVCTHQPITPCCGNDICESSENSESCPADCSPAMPDETPEEITNRAVAAAKTDRDQARELCSSLREIREQDKCFETVAKASSESLFCQPISSSSLRDACYMEFALEGDYGVCPNVENEYLRKSCESLKYLSTQ